MIKNTSWFYKDYIIYFSVFILLRYLWNSVADICTFLYYLILLVILKIIVYTLVFLKEFGMFMKSVFGYPLIFLIVCNILIPHFSLKFIQIVDV